MAHLITKRDVVFLARIPELFSGKGWHGLGRPNDNWSREALAAALFSHEYADAGIMRDGSFMATGERYAIAADDGMPVGPAVGARYWTPQNADLYALFCDAIAGSGYSVVSVLTVGNRVEFAVDAKADAIAAGRRKVSPYVGLHRAFGGISSLVISGHSTVVQCGNTTALFRREAAGSDEALSYRNTGGLEARLDDVKRDIEKAHGVAKQFAEALAAADAAPMATADAAAGFAGILSDGKPLVGATGNLRTANRVARLLDLFRNGKGNRGESVGDWFNAATDFYTHESATGGDKLKQWSASEFGTARDFKARLAARLFKSGAVRHDALADIVDAGRRSLLASDVTLLASAGLSAN
jgi:hypothetical protein